MRVHEKLLVSVNTCYHILIWQLLSSELGISVYWFDIIWQGWHLQIFSSGNDLLYHEQIYCVVKLDHFVAFIIGGPIKLTVIFSFPLSPVCERRWNFLLFAR